MCERALTLSEDGFHALRAMVCAWINEGFTRPPSYPEEYRLFDKLGIRQFEVRYDITPAQQAASPPPAD